MTPSRRIDIRIRSRYDDIPLVRRVLASLREEVSLTDDAFSRIAVCLIEALGNAIRHAYRMREDGLVDVSFTLRDDRLVIDVTDEGRAMTAEIQRRLTQGPPLPLPDQTAVQDLPEGGMGFPILRAALDGVEYSTAGGRNRLRMTKRLGGVTSPAI